MASDRVYSYQADLPFHLDQYSDFELGQALRDPDFGKGKVLPGPNLFDAEGYNLHEVVSNACRYLGDVTAFPESECGMLVRAVHVDSFCHRNIIRRCGEPYWLHPLAVYTELHRYYSDPIMLASALMHDGPEDCPDLPIAKINMHFPLDVGVIVEALTKVSNMPLKQYYDQIFTATEADPRVILIKLADFYDNVRTLSISHDPVWERKWLRKLFGPGRDLIDRCRYLIASVYPEHLEYFESTIDRIYTIGRAEYNRIQTPTLFLE